MVNHERSLHYRVRTTAAVMPAIPRITPDFFLGAVPEIWTYIPKYIQIHLTTLYITIHTTHTSLTNTILSLTQGLRFSLQLLQQFINTVNHPTLRPHRGLRHTQGDKTG